MSMREIRQLPFYEEATHACRWWVKMLSSTESTDEKDSAEKRPPLSQDQIDTFSQEFIRLLCDRYQGHWYKDNPLQGSGYRAISFDTRMDMVLSRAAEAARITDLEERLEPARFYVMYVNPGQVKVRNNRLFSTEAEIVWASPDAVRISLEQHISRIPTEVPTSADDDSDDELAGDGLSAPSDVPRGSPNEKNGRRGPRKPKSKASFNSGSSRSLIASPPQHSLIPSNNDVWGAQTPQQSMQGSSFISPHNGSSVPDRYSNSPSKRADARNGGNVSPLHTQQLPVIAPMQQRARNPNEFIPAPTSRFRPTIIHSVAR